MRKLDPEQKYWFEPHGTGFGYGPPTCKQGWIALLLYCFLAYGPLFLVIAPWGRQMPAIAWIIGNMFFWNVPYFVLCHFKAPPINTKPGDVQLEQVKHRLAQNRKESVEQEN